MCVFLPRPSVLRLAPVLFPHSNRAGLLPFHTFTLCLAGLKEAPVVCCPLPAGGFQFGGVGLSKSRFFVEPLEKRQRESALNLETCREKKRG